MRPVFFLLLFLSLSFAMFSQSKLTIERTWTIVDGGGPVDFKGALAVNDSAQRITSFETSEGAETFTDESGALWIRYRGPTNGKELQVTGKATVEVDFIANITSDSKLPSGQAKPSELTGYDSHISSQAYDLADAESSLRTIVKLVNWVNSAVEYDDSYWDKIKNASEVFDERKGVCVQYTHLLISMARSLGFETRYVSGYVYINSWQPHTWAQIKVPGNGWISADATLGQVGDLDSTHLAISFGEDQLSTPDILLSKNTNSTLTVDDLLTKHSIGDASSHVNISTSLDSESYLVSVNITNTADTYSFGSYKFAAPDEYGISESAVVLLEPNKSQLRYYGLNYSLFNNSHSYTIPVSVQFNDVKQESLLQANGNSSCLPAAMLSMLLMAALWRNLR